MTNAKFIRGIGETRQVYFDGNHLSPSRSLAWANHSPDGFNWGYGGSGPAQLALAILIEFGVDEQNAVRLHQEFKNDVIAGLEQGKDFELLTSKVGEWLASKRFKIE